MTTAKIKFGRRSFLQRSALAGGGLMLGFDWFANLSGMAQTPFDLPEDFFEINAYLKIASNGDVILMAPNPEFGTNVKTSLPMLIAEDLDVAWEKVQILQAPLEPSKYGRQFTGGSMAILTRWQPLRTTGAAAKQMLKTAAARAWEVPVSEINTKRGTLFHAGTGKSAGYGEFAEAASNLPVPEEVELKEPGEFRIIGTSRPNIDATNMAMGKPLYNSDTVREGMLYATVAMPPAFGMKLKSFDATEALAMPGIKDVFVFKSFNDDFKRSMFDTNTFPELIAIVGDSTHEVMNARLRLKADYEPFQDHTFTMAGWRGDQTITVPAGLESTKEHHAKMKEAAARPGRVVRKDGNPEEAFENAARILERTYTAPFLAHNPMEPITAFAHVTDDTAFIAGPMQAPENTRQALSARLELPEDQIHIELPRMGGGFGRHFFAHSSNEAAVISQTVKAPVKLVYSREDTMRFGIYRPTYLAVYRAALDEQNNITAFHVKAGGVPESPLNANAFPAGAFENYLAEEFTIPSNITVGWFRAPSVNFMGGAEQSFLDELAENVGKDPVEFRLDLFKRAIKNPVGERNDYDAARYVKVIEEVRDRSDWGKDNGKSRGMAAYYCHNSYAAHVFDMVMENGEPRVEHAVSVVDCGIVVNPGASENMVQGNVVDAIGHAMYGELAFEQGEVQMDNFDTYRLIRMNEAPEKIDVHFVQSEVAPTGLGEPPYPPAFAAVANALYKLTGKRYYHQPYSKNSFD